MITKLTASLLFAHSFKLVDKEGNEWEIKHPDEYGDLILKREKSQDVICELEHIGKYFFVLCRPYSDLTKEVNGVVPILELAKCYDKEFNNYIDYQTFPSSNNDFGHYVLIIEQGWNKKQFVFEKGVFYVDNHNDDDLNTGLIQYVPNQELLFNKLYSLHFKPSSLPDECCRFIND